MCLWKTGTITDPNHRSVDHGPLLPFDLGAGLCASQTLRWSAYFSAHLGCTSHPIRSVSPWLATHTFTLFAPGVSLYSLSPVAG